MFGDLINEERRWTFDDDGLKKFLNNVGYNVKKATNGRRWSVIMVEHEYVRLRQVYRDALKKVG